MPALPRRIALAAALALLAGSAAGCGIRFDEPPPPLPTADAAEIARADAVASAEAIAELAQAVAASQSADDLAVVVAQIAQGSQRQAQSLGGTWSPPPRPSPAPTPAASPLGDVSAAGLTTSLIAGAASARAASTEAGPDLGRLLVSIAVWRDLAARAVVDASAADDDGFPVLPTGGVDQAGLRVSTLGENADLLRGLDGTAFAYESLAARASDETLRATWLARSTALRQSGETIAVAGGVAETGADPRQGVYDVAALLELDPSAAVASMESALAQLWLHADVPAGARPASADAALECYLTALAAGAQLGALDSPGVVLPGFVTP